MSNLFYQNYNNKCVGWVNPSNLFFGPEIVSLTGYQSPSGSNTVVSIQGKNFVSYSVIRFGTFTPTVYFINSNLLSFYVPNTLSSGTFPVQVCNGAVCSNIVNYTIDNASGYWLLNSDESINNTNSKGVKISWLSRGAPITINPPTSIYIVPNNVNWINYNNTNPDENLYVILPTGSIYIGREIMFRVKYSTGGNILSPENIINPINDPSPQHVIIDSNYFQWVTLVYDGTIWFVMQIGSSI